MSKFRIYAQSIAVPLLLGAAVGLLTSSAMDYSVLRQPPLSPPAILFPIVWFAFFWLLLLDVLVIVMLVRFYRKDKATGLLQIPYTVWVLFATYLNFGVWLLN